METLADLAQALRQLRRREARRRDDSQLTYRELAARTGWSRGIIGAYLAGDVLPPTDRLDVLVRLLGATPAEQGALATARDGIEERRRGATSANPVTATLPPQVPADAPPRPLSVAEARILLVRRLGLDRVSAEPHAVDAIFAMCARSPLALTVFAARAAECPRVPIARLAEELRGARIDGVQVGSTAAIDDAVDTAAWRVFTWSYQKLGVEAARLFRLLGIHPCPHIASPAAASLAGLAGSQARAALAEIARACLATERPPDGVALPEPLRAYATRLALTFDSDAERQTALLRVLDHYLCTAQRFGRPEPVGGQFAGNGPPPRYAGGASGEKHVDHQPADAWFTTQYPVLLDAIRRAARSDQTPVPGT